MSQKKIEVKKVNNARAKKREMKKKAKATSMMTALSTLRKETSMELFRGRSTKLDTWIRKRKTNLLRRCSRDMTLCFRNTWTVLMECSDRVRICRDSEKLS